MGSQATAQAAVAATSEPNRTQQAIIVTIIPDIP
jgi:hypothetical protein